MAPDTADGRVTLARVSEQVAAHDRLEQEHYSDLKNDIARACYISEKNAERIGALERRADVNDEQHKQIVWGQGIYASVVALLAGFLGPKG